MSTPQLTRIHDYCHRLRRYQMAAKLATLLKQAAKQERSYSEFLEELLSEMHSKSAKHLTIRLAMARLPFQKTLDLDMSLFMRLLFIFN